MGGGQLASEEVGEVVGGGGVTMVRGRERWVGETGEEL